MKVIIENIAYDTDKCEMIAMRRKESGEFEYLLRTQKGVLLLVKSWTATCLGRPARCDDLVITVGGETGRVIGIGPDYYEIGGYGKVPRNACSYCHVPYTEVRIFNVGEPCDGFMIEDDSIKDKLLQLKLIKEG